MTRALMFQGTGSDVGKTVLVAGFCRLAANKGLKVLPFKPQNMSNNAAVADDGGEIGRAQWLQALACRVPASVHMNPVLLKPQSETGSQVVVQGKVFGQARGRDYQALKPKLMAAVMESFATVAHGADLVLVEGAGSPAEINLRAGDIANMGFATAAGVPVVLVADIDRGGVIASVVGTHRILPDQDRAMIAGYLINKFRGDVSLFDDGISAIRDFTGWPCLGVIPWLKAAARLPAEDSVALERLTRGEARALKIAVPVLSRIANFDDFDPLRSEPEVELVFVRPGERLPDDAGLVIVPGSKSTIADLADFRLQGWDQDLQAHRRRGGRIIGICGGYQMLGRSVSDPERLEGGDTVAEGLGLLDIETEMRPGKRVRNTQARSAEHEIDLSGYEIHLGVSHGPDCARPMTILNGRPDGAISPDGKVKGTYLHGLFGSDAYRAQLLREFGVQAGMINYRQDVDTALDEIASDLDRLVGFEQLVAAAGLFRR
ncbi:cobyric acid synthase [Hoeflea sp. YIM 152468]|uniref:cobyric acid synthase n=1 Tax=Hoeflea sp. YIM 152468 TaxID=3031759 RepID=UPI0023DA60A7|nr:cobyric acid synthase [Hoeflea sp. YIM 152468]MDF1607617.1 cobyric acid synthase [Hoeflea sp. YIM 152468]